MEVEIATHRTTATKLTVTSNGLVRIKLAKDLMPDEADAIMPMLLNVAEQVISKDCGRTMRGRVGNIGITMQNDSKSRDDVYFWDQLS